jgi:putative addiction module CopG family antidote
MPIALPPELERFAQQQIENGTYQSIEEILVEGVRSLWEKDDRYKGRLEECSMSRKFAKMLSKILILNAQWQKIPSILK